MKKITYKSVRGFLIILLVAQAINLSLFKGVEVAQAKLGDFIYESMTEPFLAQYPYIVQK